MNKRKSKSIEKRRIINIEVGLVAALSLLLVAFNWNSNTPTVENLGVVMDIPIEDIHIQTTKPEEIKKPELPKEKHVEIFKIIDNTKKEDDFTIDTEFDPEKALSSTEIKMNEEQEFTEKVPFVKIPEVDAEFIGGLNALYKYLASELKYPVKAKEIGASGIVYVKFQVQHTGEISDIEILRSPDPFLSEEAIRVIKKMPKWKPAEQGGRRVNTDIRIPVNFKLN